MNRRRFLQIIGTAAAGTVFMPRTAQCAAKTAPEHMAGAGYLTDPVCLKHDTGDTHPERPARLTAIDTKIEQSGLKDTITMPAPAEADMEWIKAVHAESYVNKVVAEIKSGARRLSTGDTAISRDSLDAALHAAGACMEAVDTVTAGTVKRVFCSVRPPGHHASGNRGMGFCIFNNAAVAARYAQKKHGLDRLLIIDWDVHHGNGTQEIFYADPSVMYFSVHQHPWYPGTGSETETGEGAGKGFTVNCPLPAGTGDDGILRAFDEKLIPAAGKFKPDLVVISAGFDSRAGDPLGGFKVTDAGFARLTERVMKIADDSAGGRIVSILEGGYNLKGLASAAETHLRALAKDTAAVR